MAGLFAVRALRNGRAQFDPFGEASDRESDDDDLADVELPERLLGGVRLHRINLKEERLLKAPPVEEE